MRTLLVVARWSALIAVRGCTAFRRVASAALRLARRCGAGARLGVPFEGAPGPNNAITDVAGVEVGQITHVSGEGPLKVGTGPVRTGVTVVLPRGRASAASVYGGFFDLNGNGELTGQSYLQDFGVVIGPIGISNTNAIGQVYAGIQQWTQHKFGVAATPVVAETVGWPAQRSGRIPCPTWRCHRGDRSRADRTGNRRECRGWNRNGLLRLQGWNRHRIA